jgi:hypothetical protein
VGDAFAGLARHPGDSAARLWAALTCHIGLRRLKLAAGGSNYAPDGAGDQIGDAVNVATQNRFTSASSHADVPDLSG